MHNDDHVRRTDMLTTMKEILDIAERRQCAIPAFNVYNGETIRGALQAAEETKSCVILQMYSRLFDSGDAQFYAPALLAAAMRTRVKVAFHLDHGASDETVVRAIRTGCTGVMRDASLLPFEENAAILQRVVRMARAAGVTVEGELGHIPSAQDGVTDIYTAADEAADYVKRTGVEALAIQIGTAHGHYRLTPRLAIDRIAEIHAATHAHLVLHGGSGIPDEQLRAAIRAGIRKVNFGTDVCCAFLNAARDLSAEITAVDLYMRKPAEAVKAFAVSKILLLGAQDSAEVS